jgi:hypothetical protein
MADCDINVELLNRDIRIVAMLEPRVNTATQAAFNKAVEPSERAAFLTQ